MANKEEIVDFLLNNLGKKQYLLIVANPMENGYNVDVNSNMDPNFVALVLENLKRAMEEMSVEQIKEHFTPYIVRN